MTSGDINALEHSFLLVDNPEDLTDESLHLIMETAAVLLLMLLAVLFLVLYRWWNVLNLVL